MFSLFNSEQALRSIQRIQWKHILFFTMCLTGIHFIIFEESIPTPPGKARPETEPKPPPVVDVSNAEKPKKENTPAILKFQPGDGNIDKPYDSIPIAEPIAICMSVKDQADDMIEFFVHHYHNMGIRRFYVMDDGSDPPLSSFQYPGIPRSALTFTFQKREGRHGYMQMVFYVWCFERFGDKHDWIAFLDGDEFLETPGTETLSEILKTFEADDKIGALGINWRMHTSSNLTSRPDSVRKAFTTCIFDDLEHNGENSANSHIKSIVKTSHAGPPINPHKFLTPQGSYTVGEDGDVIETDAWRRPITRKRIGVHHYAVKSRQEYEAKMLRGNGMTDPKNEAFWTEIESGNPHVNCSEMAAYEP